jgi:hypothetical protein
MKLRLLRDYNSDRGSFKKGEVVELTEPQAMWFLFESSDPKSFEVYHEPPITPDKAVDEPPVDKMIKKAPRKK